jgi:hypothetical protein
MGSCQDIADCRFGRRHAAGVWSRHRDKAVTLCQRPLGLRALALRQQLSKSSGMANAPAACGAASSSRSRPQTPPCKR